MGYISYKKRGFYFKTAYLLFRPVGLFIGEPKAYEGKFEFCNFRRAMRNKAKDWAP